MKKTSPISKPLALDTHSIRRLLARGLAGVAGAKPRPWPTTNCTVEACPSRFACF
jgi:hypothetical protein